MTVKLESIAFTPNDNGELPPFPPINGEGDDMSMDNGKVTPKDLKITEEKLNSKIDVTVAELSGKIDTSEARLAGKINTLTTKIDTQSKLLWWIMGIISAGIVGILIKLFV